MAAIEYRMLRKAEIVPELFLDFRRHQEITHCWCKEEGTWVLRPERRTIENWGEQQREFVCWCLGEILSEGGIAVGAFSDGLLKGIVSAEGTPLGSRNQYLPVAFLHVSREMRGKGIGKTLFSMAKEFAAQKGAEMLYISSQPSMETQAFYKAMGCVEAEEYIAAYVEHNPKECQIQCAVTGDRVK